VDVEQRVEAARDGLAGDLRGFGIAGERLWRAARNMLRENWSSTMTAASTRRGLVIAASTGSDAA
jgi:hypothetical protein